LWEINIINGKVLQVSSTILKIVYHELGESIVKTKSFELAVRGVNFYKYIVAEKKEYIMSKSFLRSPQLEQMST
jgi:hypothetical protein